MKKYLLFLCCIYCSVVWSQKNLATVSEFNGVKVFSDSRPVAEYDVLGEVSVSSKGDVYMINVGGMMIAGNSSLQYNELRNALVANAVLANREVDAIILQVADRKSPAATMIKFKEGQKNTNLAKVNQYMGVYTFVDCQPESDYTFKKKVKIGGLEGGYDDIRKTLSRKASKKKCNGIIVHFVTGGYDYAEAINL